VIDVSNCTSEEEILVGVWTHEHLQIRKKMKQMFDDFQQRLGQETPQEQTFLRRAHPM
jgi:hypothetical protein